MHDTKVRWLWGCIRKVVHSICVCGSVVFGPQTDMDFWENVMGVTSLLVESFSVIQPDISKTQQERRTAQPHRLCIFRKLGSWACGGQGHRECQRKNSERCPVQRDRESGSDKPRLRVQRTRLQKSALEGKSFSEVGVSSSRFLFPGRPKGKIVWMCSFPCCPNIYSWVPGAVQCAKYCTTLGK